MSKKREPFSIIKRLKSFKYAFAGLVTMIRYEHNSWVHILAAIIAVLGGCILGLSDFEWLFVAGAICLVFASHEYLESDYVRNYSEYINFIKSSNSII